MELWHFILLIFEFFLLLAWFYILWIIISDLFSDRAVSGWAKALWIVFVIFFPFLGSLVYLIARGGGMAERRAAQVQAAQSQFNDYIRQQAGTGSASELLDAKKLLDDGTITQAEFDRIKARVVG
ncbi:putative oligomerization/nucleic acid binding protein [Salana multivorans]|uniref:Putative oligomerization/nucleic acid binding protein n=1 Tax=Salana multivorans TaxID=120377 RepID=A0A3N2DB22_9MICO|nr:SHOCT domain-containing protein [Salana multivorans]ROR96927.1 putative oligomerization/nucleic acid binding protein [Salana multivorans]